MKPARAWLLFVATGLGIAALDLWTKEIAFEALNVEVVQHEGRPYLRNRDGRVEALTNLPHQDRIQVIPGFFEFEATINFGAFSGWFGRHTGWLALLSFAAIFVIAGILFMMHRRGVRPGVLLVLALGLLWGGTVGNFYDRYFIGAVRDFIKWFFVWKGEEKVWPNFNIADSSICVGVGLFILHEFFLRRPPKAAVPASDAAGA
jgi:signal peptidase II